MTSMSVTTSHRRTIHAGAVRVPTSGPYPGTDHCWQRRAALPNRTRQPLGAGWPLGVSPCRTTHPSRAPRRGQCRGATSFGEERQDGKDDCHDDPLMHAQENDAHRPNQEWPDIGLPRLRQCRNRHTFGAEYRQSSPPGRLRRSISDDVAAMVMSAEKPARYFSFPTQVGSWPYSWNQLFAVFARVLYER